MDTNVHSHIIHSSPKVGTPKYPSADKLINEYGTFIQWNLFDNKNEWNTDACYKMGEPQKYYSK